MTNCWQNGPLIKQLYNLCDTYILHFGQRFIIDEKKAQIIAVSGGFVLVVVRLFLSHNVT
jgi:hypothetical protein